MATVRLWGALRPCADGAETVDIDANTIGELLRRLEERYPKIAPYLAEGIAVSINGTIYQDSWSQQIPDQADIYLLPRIQGG